MTTCFSQEELYFNFYDFPIYKNTKKQHYTIKDEAGKTLFSKLKFVDFANQNLQVLDKNNDMFYLNNNLKRLEKAEFENYMVCGTVAYYTLSIVLENDSYKVIKKTNNEFLGDKNTSVIIDSFPKGKISKVYFTNKETSINYDDNFPLKDYIVQEIGLQKAIRFKGETFYYDTINILESQYIKIEKNGLFGYFNMIEPIFKDIGVINFNLAKVIMPNNKKGFVDLNGIIYLK